MANDFQWGPTNPHPLSKMRTELVWEGKYDEFGRRREVDVAALSMPMQRIETVDEPGQRAAADGQIDMFEQKMLTCHQPLRLQDGDRLGQDQGDEPGHGVDTVEVTNIDLTMLGHSYYGDAEAVLYDMHQLLLANTPPERRVRLQAAVDAANKRYWIVRS